MSDEEDREDTARHEAAHAAIGFSLGWTVTSVDIASGRTRCEPREDLHGAALDFEHALIASAASAFTGKASWRRDFEDDRASVRRLGAAHPDFDAVRARIEKAKTAPSVMALYRRLTEALISSPTGRLEGDELTRVLVAES